MSEREKNSIIHLHNRLKEQEDEEQIAYVKKGIKEGSHYIHRQMQRNRVSYNAFSDDEENEDRKKVVISTLSNDEEESDEENEEAMYLRQVRQEEILRKFNKQNEEEKESEEESEEEKEDDGEKFDSEEEREMEQFKKRVEHKHEVCIYD